MASAEPPLVQVMPRIGEAAGGPRTFVAAFMKAARKRGVTVTFEPAAGDPGAVLVINGTRNLRALFFLKRRRVRIVQRVGLPNAYFKLYRLGWRREAVAGLRNMLVNLIRTRIADCVVYQSEYALKKWHELHGASGVEELVIHNGVDTGVFTPDGPACGAKATRRILSVEGAQGVDPFDIALQVARRLRSRAGDFELVMIGRPHRDIAKRAAEVPNIRFIGPLPRPALPYYYRGADAFLATEVVAACPNSVLEALASGLPVLGFDAGPLPELTRGVGGCVPGNGDPWQGQAPGDFDELARAAGELLAGTGPSRAEVRRFALSRFDIDDVARRYLEALRV